MSFVKKLKDCASVFLMSIQYLNFFIIKKYSDALTHRFLYNLGKLANHLSQSKSFLSQFFFFF